jgi:chromosome segregation ATPase
MGREYRKMIRRTLIWGSAALLLMGVMFGRDAISYVRTSAGWVKQSVADNVPVEFQIERARKMIDDLEPEVRRNKHLIVREEVALEALADQVRKLESKQTQEKANLLRMQGEVASGAGQIVLAGHTYSAEQVRRDMGNRFERYKTNDETLFNLRRVLNARQQSLVSARGELEQMLASRNQLLAEVEKLEARQKMVSVAQTSSEFNLDDSVLARANQLVRDVETRLDVTERMLNADVQFAEEIPLEVPASEDIATQVAEYFGAADPQVESIAAEVTVDPQL